MRGLILVGVASCSLIITSVTDAQASKHHYRYQDSRRYISHHYARIVHTGRRITGAAIDGSRRGGLATVCAANHCGTVAASAAEKFRGLFNDLVAMGYNIGSPGCASGGHMRNSLHHWGGACDLFNQVARNRTALRQPPPSVQIEVAAKHGLTSGCAWRSPDCGHFDLSGIGRSYAMATRGHRHYRFARN
jgi:hypothetical protein